MTKILKRKSRRRFRNRKMPRLYRQANIALTQLGSALKKRLKRVRTKKRNYKRGISRGNKYVKKQI